MPSFYYSPDKLLSFNADISGVVALRGFGKTYSFKKFLLGQFLKDKKTQFLFLRQTKAQLDEVVPTFFDDLAANNEFPGELFKFTIRGNFILYCEKGKAEIRVAYFSSLSTPSNAKGVSLPYCRYAFFDEFISETNTYLKDELKKFSSIISTTMRNHPNCKILMSANALTMDNPYFRLFNVKIPKQGNLFCKNVFPLENEVTKERINLVVVFQFGSDSEKFKSEAQKSLAGKIARLTEYANSSIDNKFMLDDYSAILDRKDIPFSLSCSFNVYCRGKAFGVYIIESHSLVWLGKPDQSKETWVYKDVLEALKPNNRVLTKANRICEYLSNAYIAGQVSFESLEVKNTFVDFINYLV